MQLPLGLYPIVAVRCFPNGYAEVVRRYVGKSPPVCGRRGEIYQMSEASKKRMVWKMYKSDVDWTTMTLLSYSERFPTDGRTVKKHLSAWLTYLKRLAEKEPWIVSRETTAVYYVWFLEFTRKRQAPHIHLFLNLNREANIFHQTTWDLARKWSDIVVADLGQDWKLVEGRKQWHSHWVRLFNFHSDARNWQAPKTVDGAIRYAAKYAAKSDQKEVPGYFQDVGRFWGCSRDMPEKESMLLEMDEDGLRTKLEELCHGAERWDIIPKHLYNAPILEFEPDRSNN